MWKPGDRLSHRYNPELGPGRVLALQGRTLIVEFPESRKRLNLASSSDALVPLVLQEGSRARLEPSGEVVTVSAFENGRVRLLDGREVGAAELWPLPEEESLVDRLASGKIDSLEDFKNRLDAFRLRRLREADGLGTFLGGRIRLFPHQLYAAERACHSDPVRWLLADEVGLGKTVEACLIMNRLMNRGRAERVLVVAPDTLVVQWLGELWRKYHQVFVLIDDRRIADVTRTHGSGFNPFDAYRRAIVSMERLAADRRLQKNARRAAIDLLVVDEAHRLKRQEGQPGNHAYRAIAPLCSLGRNVLMLTATPLEQDAQGFFRLLQLLRPEELPENTPFEARLRKRLPLPPCTSATRREDIGGLPPRLPVPIDPPEGREDEGWKALWQLEQRMRGRSARDQKARKRKTELVFRALASPAALATLVEKSDHRTHEQIADAMEKDPRTKWIASQSRGWRLRREKTLIFVAHLETVEPLREAIIKKGRVRVGVFHEDLSTERRDMEVAQFRLEDGPAILISTEAGGEGRNFEFCHRLVLFDLPWNPSLVEQRIGRLDRIGRTRETEIVYFRPPGGLGRAVVDLYERLEIFNQPLSGLERELGEVARAFKAQALRGKGPIPKNAFDKVVTDAHRARNRVRQAAYHELHRDAFTREMGDSVLARVPSDLDALNEEVVIRAASRFGFEIEEQTSPRTYTVEFGSEAIVDHIPGVKPGSRFLGTFDREHAVANETCDFFAAGHQLVEGILAELDDGPRGRIALMQLAGDEEEFGLLALYRRGWDYAAVAVDGKGRERPDLAEKLLDRDLVTEHVDVRKWTLQAGWAKGIRRLAEALPQGERPQAVAAFRIRRRTSNGN